MKETDRLCACFDVGSGMTKLQIAEVSKFVEGENDILKLPWRPTRLIRTETKVLLLGHDLQRLENVEKVISQRMIDECRETIRKMLVLCEDEGVAKADIFGYATEVFRSASNGDKFLKSIHEDFGLQLKIVKQDIEAKIGFSTAAVSLSMSPSLLNNVRQENLVVWDSGGASFQLSDMNGDVFMGRLGTSVVTGLLGSIKGVDVHDEMNPVSREDYNQLAIQITNVLIEAKSSLQYDLSVKTIISIGGYTSAFAIVHLLREKLLGLKNESPFSCKFTVHELKEIIEKVLNQESKFFEEMKVPQVSMVVPKMTLLYSVMKELNLEECIFIGATGGCLGYMYLSVNDN